MTFEITVRSEEGEKERLDSLVMDIITSAAYFGKKEVEIEHTNGALKFVFWGYCPNEYLRYLNHKYDLHLNYSP
jgi:hypothetical protein